HNAGLSSLTYTPGKMRFLNNILNRPLNEKPFMIIPAGYPAYGVNVPGFKRKPLDEISVFVD
ncbi:nitroreductase family protein, partial [bacterium]|nr:nitroreductase family protein [bacterium]